MRRWILDVGASASGREPGFRPGDVYVNLDLDLKAGIFSIIPALKKRTKIKVIGLCYDLVPIMPLDTGYDYSYEFRDYIVDMARSADKILCISNSTLHDLKRFLSPSRKRCPPLDVITLGGDLYDSSGPIGSKVDTICRSPFILYVSTIDGVRKNHEILYRAYRELMRAGRKDIPKLVFAGKPGSRAEDLLARIDNDQVIRELIVILDYVSEAELSFLYRHTLFTVFPSIYEGWGLPVAESLMFGKFCLASSSSSLPEVGGSFAEYIDPYDIDGWGRRLAYYFDNPRALEDAEAKIRSEYRPATWKETAREIIDHAVNL